MSNHEDTHGHINRHVDEQLKKRSDPRKKNKLSRYAAAAAQPYLVFVSNQTTQQINGWIYFGQVNNPNIQEVYHQLPPMTQVSFQLGGPADCNITRTFAILSNTP